MAQLLNPSRRWLWTGWVLVTLIILVLLAFATLRSIDMTSGVVPDNPFEARYHEQPLIAALHMLTVLVHREQAI